MIIQDVCILSFLLQLNILRYNYKIDVFDYKVVFANLHLFIANLKSTHVFKFTFMGGTEVPSDFLALAF